MRNLTMREVLKLTGFPGPSLARWVNVGIISPLYRGSDGRGNQHVFSAGQAFSLFVGSKYRAERSSDDRVVGVVRTLASVSLEGLEAHFQSNRTFPVPAAVAERAARQEGHGDIFMPGLIVAVDLDDPALTPTAKALLQRLHLPTLLEEFRTKVAALDREPARKVKRQK